MNSKADRTPTCHGRPPRRGGGGGRDPVLLPEMFNPPAPSCGPGPSRRRADRAWASGQLRPRPHAVAGTFIERAGEPGEDPAAAGHDDSARLRNTCCVFGPDGRRLAVYRKIHLRR
jgi:predicted amidohydrolase